MSSPTESPTPGGTIPAHPSLPLTGSFRTFSEYRQALGLGPLETLFWLVDQVEAGTLCRIGSVYGPAPHSPAALRLALSLLPDETHFTVHTLNDRMTSPGGWGALHTRQARREAGLWCLSNETALIRAELITPVRHFDYLSTYIKAHQTRRPCREPYQRDVNRRPRLSPPRARQQR